MRGLSALTAGLVGDRDPAQPLVTLLAGPARVELSGATTANWVAKTANLLQSYGSPQRVGLLLPLHWSAVTLLLGGVAGGATVVVAGAVPELADCDLAFTAAGDAEAALDAGAADVFAVSTAPLGGRLGALAPMVLDAGRELPVHGDTYGGPLPSSWSVVQGGSGVAPPTVAGLGARDRVLTVLDPAAPGGLVTGLLAPLHAGAALVLAPPPGRVDGSTAAAEGVTATVGIDLPGLPRLDRPGCG